MKKHHFQNIIKTLLIILLMCVAWVLAFGETNIQAIPFFSGIILAIIARKMKTQDYDAWCIAKPIWVFIGCLLLWPLCFPIIVFGLLEIKGGYLLPSNKNTNK